MLVQNDGGAVSQGRHAAPPATLVRMGWTRCGRKSRSCSGLQRNRIEVHAGDVGCSRLLLEPKERALASRRHWRAASHSLVRKGKEREDRQQACMRALPFLSSALADRPTQPSDPGRISEGSGGASEMQNPKHTLEHSAAAWKFSKMPPRLPSRRVAGWTARVPQPRTRVCWPFDESKASGPGLVPLGSVLDEAAPVPKGALGCSGHSWQAAAAALALLPPSGARSTLHRLKAILFCSSTPSQLASPFLPHPPDPHGAKPTPLHSRFSSPRPFYIRLNRPRLFVHAFDYTYATFFCASSTSAP